MNDRDIDMELAQLERRKSKLKRLARLRSEVAAMESENLIASRSTSSMGIISEAVGVQFKLGSDFIRSRRRQEDLVQPRQVFYYLCRELTEASLESIGRFSNKDHGTVLHGYRATVNRIETNAEFSEVISGLRIACKQKLESVPKSN